MQSALDYDKRHKELMLPVVRVASRQAAGSGTVIYSGPAPDGEGFSTYILTNCHVIGDLIEIKERWSNLLKRNVKTDVLGLPEVLFFEYRWKSRAVGATTVQAEIIAYDVDEDLALLHLKADRAVGSVAKLYPKGEENKLRATMPLFAVGAGMGEPPVITGGELSQFGITIESREFWLTTAPTIFGNSGGALFLADTHELLGVPSRIRVAMFGYAADAITHLSFSIPITRVYQFFDDQMMPFLYDSTHNEADDLENRANARRSEEERILRKETEEGVSADGAEDTG